MNKSIAAALLSAVVFPGSGHLYLRRYLAAAVLIGASLLALAIIGDFVIAQVRLIGDEILAGAIPLDPELIATRVRHSIEAADIARVRIAWWALVACWLLSIVDAFRLGRAAETQARAAV